MLFQPLRVPGFVPGAKDGASKTDEVSALVACVLAGEDRRDTVGRMVAAVDKNSPVCLVPNNM